MRANTKKPHFVPAAYLQFWDLNQEPKGRDSQIYWCNSEIASKQLVKKIAVQAGLYSKNDPNSAEDYFEEFESDWAELVKELLSGRSVNKTVLAGLLILQSSYFLLRNPKFSNKSPNDRIDVYKKAIEAYYVDVLLNGRKPRSNEEGLSYLTEIWSCHLLPSIKEPWITSDNPALILAYDKHIPALIFLPINPKWALIALKKDALTFISEKITTRDVEYLNSYTAINSLRQIYSNEPFLEGAKQSLVKWFKLRPKADNYLGIDEIHLEPLNYPVANMELSFIATHNKSFKVAASQPDAVTGAT